ncbi:unnamed protein product [Symbiodinium natans]|uniref:Uncharacterized protein n=1 Tax=Symbiodinium natans TaxID=878477 RepID=A0A812SEI9_9DINO|nr:unnamed protein product [Symbiodinium natans]
MTFVQNDTGFIRGSEEPGSLQSLMAEVSMRHAKRYLPAVSNSALVSWPFGKHHQGPSMDLMDAEGSWHHVGFRGASLEEASDMAGLLEALASKNSLKKDP